MHRWMIIGLCCLLLAGCSGQMAQRPAGEAKPPMSGSPAPSETATEASGQGARAAVLPDLTARYKAALADLFAKRYDKAESRLGQLVAESPNSGTLRLAHAIALWGNGKPELAVTECRQAADRRAPLAERCLTDLREELPPLPIGEENLGDYHWDARRGYHWQGPDRSSRAEFVRVRPPTICASKQSDGFWVYHYTCGSDGRVFQWSFDTPFGGKSPKGIGLGTPLSAVTQRWGKGLEQPEGLCWYGESMRLCVESSADDQRVKRIQVTRRGLPFLVPALYYSSPSL